MARGSFILFISCLVIFLWPTLSSAQVEFTLLRGSLQDSDGKDRTFTKQFEYLHYFSGPFAFSFSYLNEGHLEEPDKHHRDGFIFQVWAKKPVLAPWFSIGAGAGPYYWYDTQVSSSGSGKFVRGVGIIGSAAATISLPWDGLYLQGRFNWVESGNNVSTKSVLLGIGTDFSSAETLDRHLPEIANDTKNEILLLSYKPFSSDGIGGIEYRRNLGILDNHVEASVSYLFHYHDIFHESYGATAQIWAVNTVKGRFKFGIGTGVFFDLLDSRHDVSNVISILFAFRISTHWNLQFCHNRIHPNRDSDEDIKTFAIGYLF